MKKIIESFVISLDDTNGQKRLRNFYKNVQEHLNGVCGQVNIFAASRHQRGGTYGCWDSHVKVLKKALSLNLDYVLIFEDDAIVTSDFSTDLLTQILSSLILLPHDWDLVGLGGVSACWASAPRRVANKFYQGPFFELHSYIASKKFMQSVLDMEYDGQVDYAFARKAYSTSYLTEKELFTQDDNLGSHNKLQQLILPLRGPFKTINRALMKLQLKIRNLVILFLFICNFSKSKNTFIASCIAFSLLVLFDSVLDPSFAFRSSVDINKTSFLCSS
jgi:hypothetical protein